ncbi:MAG: MlaE family lipid ABC transporter permease subunit [Burkholderiaceae bacterium]|nr:MlaE family lipid ABC transporter permease subunit [Burkholderiaceae bacterium]
MTQPAGIALPTPHDLVLSGDWTARGVGAVERQFAALHLTASESITADGRRIDALDTAGAWVLHRMLHCRLDGDLASRRTDATERAIPLRDLRPEFARLLDLVSQRIAQQDLRPGMTAPRRAGPVERIGASTATVFAEAAALLAFVGEIALAWVRCLAHPSRVRWLPILFNIRSAGVDALPIVGLLSFLLGVVVAYQGGDQLKPYGANIYIADLIGLSMLREFAPLITAIIIAGRSGSAYAAQIGTMAVTEEIDAMRTLGIDPQEMLVLPKITALLIALPLLTAFADLLGVLGGMVMARAQLGVGFGEFVDRFAKAISATTLLVGVGKAPVFAAVIAVVGCFQGFRTHGGADSVGRQTTRSVVQAIFLVIVADALFSIAFSALGL